jgi:hypothetical protein
MEVKVHVVRVSIPLHAAHILGISMIGDNVVVIENSSRRIDAIPSVKKRGAVLLAPQCHDRIDPRCAACRPVSGNRSHGQEQSARDCESQGVGRRDAEQHMCDKPRGRDRAGYADHNSDDSEQNPFAQDQPHN